MPKFSTPPYEPLPPIAHLKPVHIAAYLSVSVQTVHHMIERGEIKAARLIDHYSVRRDDFAAWYRAKFGVDIPPIPAPKFAKESKEQMPLFASN